MKIEDIIKECEKHNLSPNEYFVLYLIFNEKPIPKTINETAYKTHLAVKEFLTYEYKLTDKGKNIFKKDKLDKAKVESYKLMWPSLILPSGKNARSTSNELESRFKWFFDNFEYDWDTIYKATEEYIKYYQERGYNFMRTSAYFIYKENIPKLRTSTLAEWCDKVLNQNVTHESFDLDI